MALQKRLLLLGIAALAAGNVGCLAVAAGAAAAGAGATGYAYLKGKYYRDYPANLDDTNTAVKTALAELRFPVSPEERTAGKIVIESRAADSSTIHIALEPFTSRIPAEGQVTRVSIRVSAFGDEQVSARLACRVRTVRMQRRFLGE